MAAWNPSSSKANCNKAASPRIQSLWLGPSGRSVWIQPFHLCWSLPLLLCKHHPRDIKRLWDAGRIWHYGDGIGGSYSSHCKQWTLDTRVWEDPQNCLHDLNETNMEYRRRKESIYEPFSTSRVAHHFDMSCCRASFTSPFSSSTGFFRAQPSQSRRPPPSWHGVSTPTVQ